MVTTTISSGVTSSGLHDVSTSTLVVDDGGTVLASVVGGLEVISRGGVATGDFVHAGGVQHVHGIVSGAVLRTKVDTPYAGEQVVFHGGSSIDTLIRGGVEVLRAGGFATGTRVAGGSGADGYLQVEDGTAVSTQILSSGLEVVSGAAALANFASVFSGGSAIVEDGGAAHDVSVFSGGELTIEDAVVSNSTVLSDGYATVSAEGVASAVQVDVGGSLVVGSTGSAINTVVLGGQLVVQSGGVISGGAIDNSVSANVDYLGSATLSSSALARDLAIGSATIDLDGGAAIDLSLLQYDSLANLNSGASVTNTLIGDGFVEVYSGAVARHTIVSGIDGEGGFLSIEGGTAIDTVVSAGGGEGIGTGECISTTVDSGGTENMQAGTVKALTVNSSGTLAFFGQLSATVTDLNLKPGAELLLYGGASAYLDNGVLEIDTFGAPVSVSLAADDVNLTLSPAMYSPTGEIFTVEGLLTPSEANARPSGVIGDRHAVLAQAMATRADAAASHANLTPVSAANPLIATTLAHHQLA